MKKRRRRPIELYQTMSAAIAYLRRQAEAHPVPADVARAVGMSPSRFAHAFREWVGIPPRRFLAHLTKERAKRMLKASRDVLGAAHASGLSGPGRLHDLMVTHEAVSPGEFKHGKIEMRYGVRPSPFGWCVMALTNRGVSFLSFLEVESGPRAVQLIRKAWPHARLIRDDARVAPYVNRIFKRQNTKRPLPLLVRGTNFQMKVWEALLKIPEGGAAGYADIARMVGSPKAVRAVGTACGKNPVGFLIPCHRVLASSGGLGGYSGGGPKRKEAILAWESAGLGSIPGPVVDNVRIVVR